MRKLLRISGILLAIACTMLFIRKFISRESSKNDISAPVVSKGSFEQIVSAHQDQNLKQQTSSVLSAQDQSRKPEEATVEYSAHKPAEEKPVNATQTEPVVMTDYQSWTVMANEIETGDNGHSLATGEIGVAHSNGAIFVANEAVVSHTNSSGTIDSIYLPGESSGEMGNGSLTAQNATLHQSDNGGFSVKADKITFKIPSPQSQK